MAAPNNPFLPSDMGAEAPPALELARDPRPASAAPSDDAMMDLPDMPNHQPRSSPTRTVPVVYKNPDGGAGRFIIWGLAAFGLAALIWVGAGALSKRSAPVPVAAAAQEPVVEAKPVTWKAVERGNDVLVRVEVTPRGARAKARLLLDGAPLASNPVMLAKGSSHTISAIADGYQPAQIEVSADAEKTVSLTLRRDR
jgi:hypothetical protein